MAAENPTWGEERVANELKLKLSIRVSPRTVGKSLRNDRPARTPDPKQPWRTFIPRNHAKFIVAADFFVVITATFRTLYVFVVIEIESRKIVHQNVTAHPTAEWTLQQFREALPGDIALIKPRRALSHQTNVTRVASVFGGAIQRDCLVHRAARIALEVGHFAVLLNDQVAVTIHTVGGNRVAAFVWLHNDQVGAFALLHNRTMVHPATPLRRVV